MKCPLSNQEVVLKSLPRKKWKELRNLRQEFTVLSLKADKGADEDVEALRDFDLETKREDLILSIYSDIKDPDDLTQRDVVILCNATETYTAGASEASVKNLWMSGADNSDQTPSK